MQLFIVRESWNLRQFWIDKGELFRDWLERKVGWYKTGNKKKRSTLRVLPPAKKKSLQRYLLQDRFECGW